MRDSPPSPRWFPWLPPLRAMSGGITLVLVCLLAACAETRHPQLSVGPQVLLQGSGQILGMFGPVPESASDRIAAILSAAKDEMVDFDCWADDATGRVLVAVGESRAKPGQAITLVWQDWMQDAPPQKLPFKADGFASPQYIEVTLPSPQFERPRTALVSLGDERSVIPLPQDLRAMDLGETGLWVGLMTGELVVGVLANGEIDILRTYPLRHGVTYSPWITLSADEQHAVVFAPAGLPDPAERVAYKNTFVVELASGVGLEPPSDMRVLATLLPDQRGGGSGDQSLLLSRHGEDGRLGVAAIDGQHLVWTGIESDCPDHLSMLKLSPRRDIAVFRSRVGLLPGGVPGCEVRTLHLGEGTRLVTRMPFAGRMSWLVVAQSQSPQPD